VRVSRSSVGTGRPPVSTSLYVAPQPARQHPHRMQPSYDVFHPLGAAHRARHVSVASILSERSTLSPGKRLHHQRNSRSTKFGILSTCIPAHLLAPRYVLGGESASFTGLESLYMRPGACVRRSRQGRGVLPSLCRTPACAPAPPSHATVIFRVSPSRRRPYGSAWRAAAI
jgi:hypothetical protein